MPIVDSVKAALYKTVLCQRFLAGRCPDGADCQFAHGEQELRPKPDLSKTSLCPELVRTGQCSQGVNCSFAHGPDELSLRGVARKTKMCWWWPSGECARGDRCPFAHGPQEAAALVAEPTAHQAPPALPPAGAVSAPAALVAVLGRSVVHGADAAGPSPHAARAEELLRALRGPAGVASLSSGGLQGVLAALSDCVPSVYLE
mmetsp:Transcript_111062/g.254637  ORF Transcript_111062/g.254637 Transcript_111062/m.254637 type:complete len:202 (-) Transcript_111062:14-619(-)